MPIAITKDQEMAAHWKTQIEQVEKEYTRWYERCKKISKKYRDERNVIDDEQKSLNLFWANTQTLKPAIYSKVPIPICERRFLDKDTTGRVAAQILERPQNPKTPDFKEWYLNSKQLNKLKENQEMSVSFSNTTQTMNKSAHGHPSSYQGP